MPIYGFRCTCGQTEEHFFHVRDEKPSAKCGKCSLEMQRDLTVEARNHIPGSAWPMTTLHLTGKPETFASQAQLDARCKELGVTHRPDNAWISQEHQGVDFRTGKTIYKEGSGAGLPGSWV